MSVRYGRAGAESRSEPMEPLESAREEIRRISDIVELVGQFVQLRKAGQNFIGLCPFHTEKAPSFTVSPSRQMFHCFGCKKGGDVFAFWMAYHGLSFPEALRDLAERYQVTLPQRGRETLLEKQEARQKAALLEVNEVAAGFFENVLLRDEAGKPGREYLERRGLSPEIVREFRLGYAPEDWEPLMGFLRRKGIREETAFQAGLAVPRKSGGYYDRFRGRIIFPIQDLKGRIVGFGGRVIGASEPKYLNTPETPVFQKGLTLYGLHAAFSALKETGRVVVVEGYMDFLGLRSAGFREAVATLGTALTTGHARRLKGYVQEAIVVFDADEAGRKAALRALPVFANEGLPAKAVVLPGGHDPDSFVRESGIAAFADRVNQAPPLFDFFLDEKLRGARTDEVKATVLKEILPALLDIEDFPLRSLYVQRLSGRIGVKEQILVSELDKIARKGSKGERGSAVARNLGASRARSEAIMEPQILNLLAHYPERLRGLGGCEWTLLIQEAVTREILEAFFRESARGQPPGSAELMAILPSEECRVKLREALAIPPFCASQEAEQAVAEIRERIRRMGISRSIQEAKERKDVEALNALLKLKSKETRMPLF
jgi:DNA primase